MRIGVIADTHGLFDPAIRRYFHDVEHILHAGDIGDRSVIEQLEQIAPVTAVSGNVDDDQQSGFPSEAMIELAGRRIAIRHIVYQGGKLTREGRAFLEREQPDICVFGHTHQPRAEWFGKALLFNPGSAGQGDSHSPEEWDDQDRDSADDATHPAEGSARIISYSVARSREIVAQAAGGGL